MAKLKMHSPDFVEGNVAKLAELFPNCVTEAKTRTTKDTKSTKKIKKVIDFDLLRQELSGSIVEGPQERYHLNWPGKREALLTANAPIAKTLRPCREESVAFDSTQNLFIEGDNLDALKLLQETYLGKVKMIYIDPPYNTGNDFIYADKFAENTEEYLKKSNQKDEEGNRLVANTDSNGRFHSDWLSMMYPRLKLARNLLRDDGVIFISIDDGEVHNLWKICDEIFGETNFIANFVWEKRTNRENRKEVSSRHDNTLCFTKNRSSGKAINQLPMNDKALGNYKNLDNDPQGPWKSDPATAQAGHGTKSQFYELTAPNGKVHKLESGRCWLYTEPVIRQAIEDNRIWFGVKGDGVPRIKTYLHAKERGLTPETILFARDTATNEAAKNALKELFNGVAVFETPKPIDLIKVLLQITTSDGLILDFFSGSSATAHAVMKLNAEDGGNRKFIMVQLPEACDEKSEAFKAGYETIAEISKERIRRAGKKIREELITKETKDKEKKDLFSETEEEKVRAFRVFRGSGKELDTGFRVLKIDSSNMADVYYSPDQMDPAYIDLFKDNIKPDRTPEDLLFQVLLDWGVDLSLPVTRETLTTKDTKSTKEFEVFFVDGNALAACFVANGEITEEFVKELAGRKPLRVVFRDAGFKDDSVKINVEQIFKLISPQTDIKTI